MTWIDWLIVVIPVAFVMGMGWYSKRYVHGVTEFCSAGRACGRYLITNGDIANGISIIGLLGYVEVHYKTGFALMFWQTPLQMLMFVIIALSGYVVYRWRETKVMSFGQFIEMRYSRRLRIFAAVLRSLSEMLANMIMPALAARFFIYFLGLPQTFHLFGIEIPTFMALVVFCLSFGITLICFGGTLTVVITDALQSFMFYPIMVTFVVFLLVKFSWFGQVVPVMLDRAPGESFLNPFDISKLRDFNLFFLTFFIFNMVMHRASWTGAGNSCAARTPHEQKMAGLFGAWRGALNMLLYLLIAVGILTLMNHRKFADAARDVRQGMTARIAGEIVPDQAVRDALISETSALPVQRHVIGVDAPLSQEQNLDTPYLDTAQRVLINGGEGERKFQEFRTLYHQLMLAFSMRHLLPAGMMGLFCLLMIMMMISTDDSRIYSSSLTLMQDVILPLHKKGFTPKQHIRMIRLVSISVGVFFAFASIFMAQLDYIQLFVTMVTGLWMGGCAPIMIFGLYSRFGTTAGAWASMLSGMFLSLGGILTQRNWANHLYPWLVRMGWDDNAGRLLERVSAPLNPYIVWKMDPAKFPINSYEITFGIMIFTLILYIVVSKLTCKEPFNLERMLHRGKYNLDHEDKRKERWTWRNAFRKLIGITPDYTRLDRGIAWAVFLYNFVYMVGLAFIGVLIWNAISPWPLEWWGRYFLVVFLVVPGLVAVVMSVWMTVGGIRDMRDLFRVLRDRENNPLDDGRVEGHVSLADKAEMERLNHGKSECGIDRRLKTED